MNKLPSLNLKFPQKIVTTQIKALGNLIGDVLWLLEIEMIKKSESNLYTQKIKMLIDLYAEQFDELLIKQETGMLEDMGNLFKLLLNDLKGIENDNIKFYNNAIN